VTELVEKGKKKKIRPGEFVAVSIGRAAYFPNQPRSDKGTSCGGPDHGGDSAREFNGKRKAQKRR